MTSEYDLTEDKDKRFHGRELDIESFADQVLRLPEAEFWKIVSIRLSEPLSEASRNGFGTKDREYWSRNYLIEQIFLHIAPVREIITHDDKQIKVYKYYNQALRLAKWIPITKPAIEFVINTSDLTVRILAELKALGPEESQQVLKLAVVQIFENVVGPTYTHGSIVRNLHVRLDG